MSLYLKKFETTSQYEQYVGGPDLILPNVSLCDDTNKVHYNPDPYNGHEYVEIGGLKWATMNIGANSITDTGLYFAWGDTQGYTADQVTGSTTPHKDFAWADYKFTSGNSEPQESDFTKYNLNDGLKVLQPSDDAVQAAWGGAWRMPTTEEFLALGEAVTTAWTQINDVYGMLCTDKTDNSKTLFFPAAGFCDDGSVGGVGSYGYYWSSSLISDDVFDAYQLYFSSDNVYWDNNDYRGCGYPVRGVVGQNS